MLCPDCGKDTRVKETHDMDVRINRLRVCVCGFRRWTVEEYDPAATRTGKGPVRTGKAPIRTNTNGPPPNEDQPPTGNGGGGRGGSAQGSGSGSGSDTTGVGSEPWKTDPRVWAPHVWNQKYGMAWTNRYNKFYGMQSDAKACGALGDLLERLPLEEILDAQAKAPRMFAAFLASDAPKVVQAKHPFAFFVTEFGGLRLVGDDEPGSRKLPEYD